MSLRESSFLVVNDADVTIEEAVSPPVITDDNGNRERTTAAEDDASSTTASSMSDNSRGFTIRRHVIAIYNRTFADMFDFDWMRLLEYIDQHTHRIHPSAYASGERVLKMDADALNPTEPIDIFDCITTLATLNSADDKKDVDANVKSTSSQAVSLSETMSTELTGASSEVVGDSNDDDEEDDDDGEEIFHYKIVIVCSDQHHELPRLRAWQTQLSVLAEMPNLAIEYVLYGPEFPAIRQHWASAIDLQLKDEDERFRERYASEDDRKVWLDELFSPSLTPQIMYTGVETRRLVPDMASRWIGEMMEHEAIISGNNPEEDDEASSSSSSGEDTDDDDTVTIQQHSADDSTVQEKVGDNNDDDDDNDSTSSSDTDDNYINPDSPPVQLLLIEDAAMDFTLAQMRTSWRPLFSNNTATKRGDDDDAPKSLEAPASDANNETTPPKQ